MDLEKLKYHLKNTSDEELRREWVEIEAMNLGGPTVEEFLEQIKNGKIYKQWE